MSNQKKTDDDKCVECGGEGIFVGRCSCQNGEVVSPCPTCRGSGNSGRFGRHPCAECGGSGVVGTPCQYCRGRGELRVLCQECHGTGKLPTAEQIQARARMNAMRDTLAMEEHKTMMQIIGGIRA
jgi:DnaJ-class molecular chaperone